MPYQLKSVIVDWYRKMKLYGLKIFFSVSEYCYDRVNDVVTMVNGLKEKLRFENYCFRKILSATWYQETLLFSWLNFQFHRILSKTLYWYWLVTGVKNSSISKNEVQDTRRPIRTDSWKERSNLQNERCFKSSTCSGCNSTNQLFLSQMITVLLFFWTC